MQSETFMDGHCERHTVTRVHRDVRRASRNVQESTGRREHGGRVESLKPGLRHALSVSIGVRGASMSETGCSSSATSNSLSNE